MDQNQEPNYTPDELYAIMNIPTEQASSPIPSALESERVVLSTAINRRVELSVLFAAVQPKHFHLRANRILAEEILALDKEGMEPERKLIQQSLKFKGLEREAGGATYLSELENTVFPANWEDHCTKMIQAYMLRLVYEKISAMAMVAKNAEIGQAQKIINDADRMVQDLLDVANERASTLVSPGAAARELGVTLREWASQTAPDVPFPFKCGLAHIDGFRAEELIIIGGRPGMGKSAIGLRMIESWCQAHIPVALFSLEMSTKSLVSRMACSLSNVSSVRIRAGATNPISYFEEQRLDLAFHEVDNWPIVISDKPYSTVYQMKSALRPLVKKGIVKILVIDYLGLMKTPERAENRHNELGEISRDLKVLAKELQIPIIALHQLSRDAAKGGAPSLHHLRESGRIEEDADIVLLVHQKITDTDEREVETDLIIAKQRNGPTGHVPLIFRKNVARFEERYCNE
jgi:replicative DNA helicase